MAGFYSGLLEGMTGLANIRHQQMLDLATQSRIQGDKEQRQLQQLEAAMGVQKYNQEIADRQVQAKLASMAFNQNQPEKELDEVSSTTSTLANQFQTYGKGLLAAGQGKLGMDVLKEVDNMRRQATQDQLTSLQISAQKMEQAGEILSSVGTNEELYAALPQLAKLSVVPPQHLFQNGRLDINSEPVKAWIAGKSSESKTGLEKIKAGILGLQLAEKVKEQQALAQQEQEKTFQTDSNERRSQAGVTPAKPTSSPVVSALSTSADKTRTGVYERVYGNAVVTSSSEVSKSAENLKRLTQGGQDLITAGVYTDLNGGGLLSSTNKFLGTQVTSRDALMYESILKPIIGNLVTLKNSGRLATQAAIDLQLKALVAPAGSDHIVQVQKLGQFRQQYDAAIEAALVNPALTKDQKDKLVQDQQNLHASIPFTENDVLDFYNEVRKKKDFSTDLQTWLHKKYGTTPDKETVIVNDKSYSKPANWSSEKWEAYKRDVGAK